MTTEPAQVKSRVRPRAADNSLEALTGLALGLAIGVLTGLSISSVVGQVVVGLVALLAGFLGFVTGSDAPSLPSKVRSVSRLRVIGLCCGILAGAASGILARTHDILSPSLSGRAEAWRKAGVPEDEAWRLVVAERLGITLGDDQAGADERPATRFSTVLFGGPTSGELARLDPDDPRNTRPAMWLNAMVHAENPAWKRAAEQLAPLEGNDDALRAALNAVWAAMNEVGKQRRDTNKEN